MRPAGVLRGSGWGARQPARLLGHISSANAETVNGNFTQRREGAENSKPKRKAGESKGDRGALMFVMYGFRYAEEFPAKEDDRDREPRVVGWKNDFDDLVRAGVGFDPRTISEVCHDVPAVRGNGQIPQFQIGMIGLGNALARKQRRGQSSVTVTKGRGRAIVPPQGRRVSNRPPVKRTESVKKLPPNKPLPNES